ncbi:hypothetical protein [Aquimarina pacifica]|uniref:hypothetical protein n=1 Tax=Aquimarina pacifica TaxID=1296415 RepID=UPI00068774C8|nr:hypothetical protein [Aquimarina pacifica]
MDITPTSKKPMNSFCICYNLIDSNIVDIPLLPEAYIVPLSNEGHLEYIEKQATSETLNSHGLEYLDTPHEQLLDICTKLKPNTLKKRFQTVQRKKLTLSDLLKDPKKKEVILMYVHKKLAVFFELIYTHRYFISYNAERKDRVEDHKLTLATNHLHPIPEFTKTEDGIEYAFSLKDGEKIFIPQKHNIVVLLNEPAWISIDKKVYPIQNLNANKLKPFQNKEKITIAKKHIKTYVEKIIIPVIKNIDVIANGFDILTYTDIKSKRIEVVQDFIRNIYVAKVFFEYHDVTFEYNGSKSTYSTVLLNQSNDLQVIQTKRNPKNEQEHIDFLVSLGLHVNNNLMLELEGATDPYEILEWISQNRKQLENQGFEIKLPLFEGKNSTTAPYNITISNQKKKTGLTSKVL